MTQTEDTQHDHETVQLILDIDPGDITMEELAQLKRDLAIVLGVE